MQRDADAHQNDMEGPICTYLIIGFTCVFSFFGFRSQAVEDKYIFDPERILAGNEFYRLITSSFLHSGWVHLMCNMISLNAYGSIIELSLGKAQFLLSYFGAVIGRALLSLYLHRHHEYRAYGASGGVCGIIFAFILLWPGALIRIFPIPLLVPGWLFGIVFLVASFFMMKAHNKGNIGHDAHL